MAQTFLTNLQVTRNYLEILHSYMHIVKNFDHSYQSNFTDDGSGLYGKIGPTINIRKPNQFTIRSQWEMQIQPITEQSVPLTIDTVAGADLEFPESALALTVEDFDARYNKPSALKLASNVEANAGKFALNSTYNQVGTIGTTPNTASIISDARVRLVKNLMPPLERPVLICNPETSGSMASVFTTLYNPQPAISEQYRTGLMSSALGFDWYESQVLSAHTNGSRTDTTPVVAKAAIVNGQATIAITASSSGTWKKGDIFTMGTTAAGCLAVNQETKQPYSYLQQFVVTADNSVSSSSQTLSISPTPYISGPLQNVDVSTMASTGNLVISLTGGGSGAASTIYANDLAFSNKAFAFAAAKLDTPTEMGVKAWTATWDGLSIRFMKGYDIFNARRLSRIDIFYGLAALRPEFSCRIIGKNS